MSQAMVSFRKVIDRGMLNNVGVSCLDVNSYLVFAKEDLDGKDAFFAYDLNEAFQFIPMVRRRWDQREAGDVL